MEAQAGAMRALRASRARAAPWTAPSAAALEAHDSRGLRSRRQLRPHAHHHDPLRARQRLRRVFLRRRGAAERHHRRPPAHHAHVPRGQRQGKRALRRGGQPGGQVQSAHQQRPHRHRDVLPLPHPRAHALVRQGALPRLRPRGGGRHLPALAGRARRQPAGSRTRHRLPGQPQRPGQRPHELQRAHPPYEGPLQLPAGRRARAQHRADAPAAPHGGVAQARLEQRAHLQRPGCAQRGMRGPRDLPGLALERDARLRRSREQGLLIRPRRGVRRLQRLAHRTARHPLCGP